MIHTIVRQKAILVGPGAISKEYVRAAKAIDEIQIVGVVSRSLERARSYAEEMNIQYWGNTIRDVAAKSDAKIVIICTPNGAHREAVLEAAAFGLHVLCEKPLAISPVSQTEMIAACRKTGVKLGVSYLYRFLPHMQELKRLIDGGCFGSLLTVDAKLAVWRDSTYYSKSTWHGTELLDGGGAFIQQGSHILDMANWLAGGYHKVECARRFTLLHPIPVEDQGYAVVRYKSGAVGMIECSTVKKNMNAQEIRITGTQGSACVSFQKVLEWSVDATPPLMVSDESVKKEFLFQELLRDFCKAITHDRNPFVTGDSAQKTGELIFDIYDAAGQPIKQEK
jgi:predicted dehydrogenase